MEMVWAFFVGGDRDATWLEVNDRFPTIEFPKVVEANRTLTDCAYTIDRYVKRVWVRQSGGVGLRDSLLVMAHESIASDKNRLDGAAHAAFLRAAAPFMLAVLNSIRGTSITVQRDEDVERAIKLAGGELPATEMREGHLLSFRGVPIERGPPLEGPPLDFRGPPSDELRGVSSPNQSPTKREYLK